MFPPTNQFLDPFSVQFPWKRSPSQSSASDWLLLEDLDGVKGQAGCPEPVLTGLLFSTVVWNLPGAVWDVLGGGRGGLVPEERRQSRRQGEAPPTSCPCSSKCSVGPGQNRVNPSVSSLQNFHPACFEDYKNVSLHLWRCCSLLAPPLLLMSPSLSPNQTSSYLEATPSPSRLLTEHPLGALVKTEEEEPTPCQVKQEAASDRSAVPQQEEPEPPVLEDSARPEERAWRAGAARLRPTGSKVFYHLNTFWYLDCCGRLCAAVLFAAGCKWFNLYIKVFLVPVVCSRCSLIGCSFDESSQVLKVSIIWLADRTRRPPGFFDFSSINAESETCVNSGSDPIRFWCRLFSIIQ